MSYESITTSANTEALYTAFFEALSSKSYLMRADAPRYTILAVTNSHLELTGLQKEDMIGRGVFDVFPPNTSDPSDTGGKDFLASLQYVLSYKKPHYLPAQRYDITDSDGRFVEKYWRAESKPVLSPDSGEVLYIIHTTEDITDQVKAAEMKEQIKGMEEAAALKRLYETITNNTPDLIYVFDLNYRFTYANNALLTMWGKTWEDAIDKGLRENGYEEWHAAMHEREIDHVVATKEPVRGEVSFPHAVLGKRVYDYILVPVLNSKGEVEAVAGTTRDITEHKLAELSILESNERFRNLADDSPMFVFIIDVGELAPVSFWNKTWLRYTGQSNEEAMGRAWDGIIHPDDVPVVMSHYTPAFQNRQPYFIPWVRVKRYDGEYRWHAFKGNPRHLPNGQFNGFVGVGFDVHEQKLAEEALKQSEAKARAAVDIARLGTFEINVLKQSILHSPRLAEILGLDPSKQWPYQTVINAVHPDDMAIRLKALERAKETGVLFYEARILQPDQIVRWVRLNGRYLYQESQPMIVGTLMDITQEKKTAEELEHKVMARTMELQAANEELKRSNQNLEEFAHAASHDLKEPVRKIHFFTNQLKNQLSSLLNAEQEKAFSRIENATERMGNLIDDLLLYSHVSHRPIEMEMVDLNTKVQRVLEDLELDIREKKALINVERLPVVKGYRRQLQQLFQNLISNALKYSKSDVPPRIEISATKVMKNEKPYYQITVKDNGIGFQPEYADKIFQMFTRLHGKGEYSGTGVGLSIAKKVVDNHNGLIRAESTVGEGSAFLVYLPEE